MPILLPKFGEHSFPERLLQHFTKVTWTCDDGVVNILQVSLNELGPFSFPAVKIWWPQFFVDVKGVIYGQNFRIICSFPIWQSTIFIKKKKKEKVNKNKEGMEWDGTRNVPLCFFLFSLLLWYRGFKIPAVFLVSVFLLGYHLHKPELHTS